MTHAEHLQLQREFVSAHSSYRTQLKARALFKLHDRSRSDDVVQTTFMKLWSYLMRGGKIEMMEAFLYHVLNRLIIDEYRKQRPESLDVLLAQGYEPTYNDTDRKINTLDGTIALHLIDQLPSKYRNILHMRFVEELSFEEMAERTGKSKNTLAVQIHRGLGKLRKLYLGLEKAHTKRTTLPRVHMLLPLRAIR